MGEGQRIGLLGALRMLGDVSRWLQARKAAAKTGHFGGEGVSGGVGRWGLGGTSRGRSVWKEVGWVCSWIEEGGWGVE